MSRRDLRGRARHRRAASCHLHAARPSRHAGVGPGLAQRREWRLHSGWQGIRQGDRHCQPSQVSHPLQGCRYLSSAERKQPRVQCKTRCPLARQETPAFSSSNKIQAHKRRARAQSRGDGALVPLPLLRQTTQLFPGNHSTAWCNANYLRGRARYGRGSREEARLPVPFSLLSDLILARHVDPLSTIPPALHHVSPATPVACSPWCVYMSMHAVLTAVALQLRALFAPCSVGAR